MFWWLRLAPLVSRLCGLFCSWCIAFSSPLTFIDQRDLRALPALLIVFVGLGVFRALALPQPMKDFDTRLGDMSDSKSCNILWQLMTTHIYTFMETASLLR